MVYGFTLIASDLSWSYDIASLTIFTRNNRMPALGPHRTSLIIASWNCSKRSTSSYYVSAQVISATIVLCGIYRFFRISWRRSIQYQRQLERRNQLDLIKYNSFAAVNPRSNYSAAHGRQLEEYWKAFIVLTCTCIELNQEVGISRTHSFLRMCAKSFWVSLTPFLSSMRHDVDRRGEGNIILPQEIWNLGVSLEWVLPLH